MIILASKSPRRRELMESAGFEFEIIPATKDEVIPSGLHNGEIAEAIASQKAFEIAEKHPADIVVGADTIVVCGNEVMGKPKDGADAVRMLKKLSGQVHCVYTGVCIISPNHRVSFYDTTEVEFYPISDDELSAYIESGEPFDKAGAYGIQGSGAMLIKGIKGDYYNVMGLPIARVYREIKNIQ